MVNGSVNVKEHRSYWRPKWWPYESKSEQTAERYRPHFYPFMSIELYKVG
jgi:hypothetical protein